MNILHTLTTYLPSIGGAQIHHHQLIKHLMINHNNSVMTFWDRNRTDWLLGTTLRADSDLSTYSFEGVNINKLGFFNHEKYKMIPYIVSYYGLMSWSINNIANIVLNKIKQFEYNPDIIHNVRIGREPLSVASYNYSRLKDIPFVLTPIHHPRWEGWPYNEYVKLYKLADMVIALTENEKKILIKLGVKEEKIIITGIGPILLTDNQKPNFKEKYNIDGPMVLFVGQHFEYKGYKKILISAKSVWEKYPEAHFVFIGPKYKTANKHFKLFKDEKRILSLDLVSLEEKTNALASCDIFCLPSTQESFGGAYTEAWSFKKPVIGCNIPAVSEVIDDCKNGLLINQESMEISSSIIELLDNFELSTILGEAGYKKVNEKYSWDKLVSLTEDGYRKLIN